MYFLISPSDYYRNLLDEEWGCFKHIGMSWDMIMTLPIQERRALIHKHNVESDRIERDIEQSESDSSIRTVEGSAINRYAKISQSDLLGG